MAGIQRGHAADDTYGMAHHLERSVPKNLCRVELSYQLSFFHIGTFIGEKTILLFSPSILQCPFVIVIELLLWFTKVLSLFLYDLSNCRGFNYFQMLLIQVSLSPAQSCISNAPVDAWIGHRNWNPIITKLNLFLLKLSFFFLFFSSSAVYLNQWHYQQPSGLK